MTTAPNGPPPDLAELAARVALGLADGPGGSSMTSPNGPAPADLAQRIADHDADLARLAAALQRQSAELDEQSTALRAVDARLSAIEQVLHEVLGILRRVEARLSHG